MGQGITLTSGYGWVIDEYRGDYVANLGQFLPEGARSDVREWAEEALKENDLEVVIDSFGYDFASLALLHKASAVDSYDWFHSAADHAPKTAAQDALRRELLQALDVLGWDEAGLGEPSWLILVTYG